MEEKILAVVRKALMPPIADVPRRLETVKTLRSILWNYQRALINQRRYDRLKSQGQTMNRREFFFTATAVPFLKPQRPRLKFKYLNETISIPVNVSAEEWEKGFRLVSQQMDLVRQKRAK